jgi:hypothetical protein
MLPQVEGAELDPKLIRVNRLFAHWGYRLITDLGSTSLLLALTIERKGLLLSIALVDR